MTSGNPNLVCPIGALYWLAVPTVSSTVTVHCRGCGEPRQVSYRQSRRAGLCNRCLFPPNVRVTSAARKYWFNTFTDREIASIASDLIGSVVPVAAIAERRQALTASSRKPAK